MPAKKNAKKPQAARKTPCSPSELREEGAKLRAIGEALKKIADLLEKKGVASIDVDGQSMMRYGLRYVQKFVANVQKELTLAEDASSQSAKK